MSEGGYGLPVLEIKVTETDFQGSEEKTLPIPESLVVLAYHRVPVVGDLRQAHGACFQPGQVAQYVGD